MTRFEYLLKLVADRPQGEKVNIPAIVRYFTPTQARIVEAIQHLIDAGHLDPVTLRRVKIAEPICAPEESTAEDRDSPPCEEPPGATAADDDGGGDARCGAPPPIDFDRLLECFGDDFETLRVVAQRYGAKTHRNIVRHAITLHERGLVEQSPPRNGQPFCLWRRAQQNTRGASGTVRKTPGVEESTPTKAVTAAERIEDRAPPTEPGSPAAGSARQSPQPVRRASPSAAPPAMAVESEVAYAVAPVAPRPALEKPPREVDSKVNIGPRDPTQEPNAELFDAGDRIRERGYRNAANARRGAEAAAAERLDAGLPGRNSMERSAMFEIQKRREAEARLADPLEQAKTVIRRRTNESVFNADVTLGEHGKGKVYVGRRLFTHEELLAYAKRLAA